jgi:serine/threonine-protein kinase
MSPEQAAGELDIDGRSDLYSLGVLGYYMLTGDLPFDGATFESLAAKHITETPIPVHELTEDVPSALAGIVEKCMAKTREGRFKSGAELADALEAVRVGGRRWLRTAAASTGLLRGRFAAELAMFGAALKAVVWKATAL